MSGQGPQESFLAFHRLCLRLGAVTLGIKIKVWRDRRADPLASGLVQLERYLDGGRRRCGQTVVNRVIVDLGCHTMKDFGILVRFGPSQCKDLLKLRLSASQRLAFYVGRIKF